MQTPSRQRPATLNNGGPALNCKVIFSDSDVLAGYGDHIMTRFKAMKMPVEPILAPQEVSFEACLIDVASRGAQIAMHVGPEFQTKHTCNVHILHGSPEMHLNMPLEMGLGLVQRQLRMLAAKGENTAVPQPMAPHQRLLQSQHHQIPQQTRLPAAIGSTSREQPTVSGPMIAHSTPLAEYGQSLQQQQQTLNVGIATRGGQPANQQQEVSTSFAQSAHANFALKLAPLPHSQRQVPFTEQQQYPFSAQQQTQFQQARFQSQPTFQQQQPQQLSQEARFQSQPAVQQQPQPQQFSQEERFQSQLALQQQNQILQQTRLPLQSTAAEQQQQQQFFQPILQRQLPPTQRLTMPAVSQPRNGPRTPVTANAAHESQLSNVSELPPLIGKIDIPEKYRKYIQTMASNVELTVSQYDQLLKYVRKLRRQQYNREVCIVEDDTEIEALIDDDPALAVSGNFYYSDMESAKEDEELIELLSMRSVQVSLSSFCRSSFFNDMVKQLPSQGVDNTEVGKRRRINN